VRALIVEQGFTRGALAAVRALAAAGWTVGVGSPMRFGLAGTSRFCAWQHRIPAVHIDVAGFVAGVVRAVEQHGYDIVFGACESEVLVLSEHRSAIPACIPHSSHDLVCAALNKSVLHHLAAMVGMSIPVEVAADQLKDDATPYIVKAAVHAQPGRIGAPPRLDTTAVVGGEAAWLRAVRIRELGGEPHIQQFRTGRLMAYSAVT